MAVDLNKQTLKDEALILFVERKTMIPPKTPEFIEVLLGANPYEREMKPNEGSGKILVVACVGTPSEVMKCIRDNPSETFHLYEGRRMPLRLRMSVFADGKNLAHLAEQGYMEEKNDDRDSDTDGGQDKSGDRDSAK